MAKSANMACTRGYERGIQCPVRRASFEVQRVVRKHRVLKIAFDTYAVTIGCTA